MEEKFKVRRHVVFDAWFKSLEKRDSSSYDLIYQRFVRIEMTGHLGDCRHVGDGVWELRFHFGAGHRVYYILRGKDIILLLCGGVKTGQSRDIELAKRLAREVRNG